MNLVERVELINVCTASLEPILKKKRENYNFSLENFNSIILNLTLSIITRLYSFQNLNKKNAHYIINEILYTYLSESFEILKRKYGNTNDICNYFRIIKNNLKKFKTARYFTILN